MKAMGGTILKNYVSNYYSLDPNPNPKQNFKKYGSESDNKNLSASQNGQRVQKN
jgi:hypothetical protein